MCDPCDAYDFCCFPCNYLCGKCPGGVAVLAPIGVGVLIISIYTSFVYYTLLPQFLLGSSSYALVHFILFHISFFLLNWSLIRCLLAKEHLIMSRTDMKAHLQSSTPSEEPKIEGMVTKESKWDGSVRICRKCNIIKPDRTHHCSSCNTCVLKMDHHCGFINKCIGYWNYKFFLCFVIWASLTCTYVAIYIAFYELRETFIEMVLQGISPYARATKVCVTFLAALLLALILAGFSFLHILFVSNNYTTLEYCEKRRDDDYEHPWGLGFLSNLSEVFGEMDEFYIWLLPVNPKKYKKAQGLSFQTRTSTHKKHD